MKRLLAATGALALLATAGPALAAPAPTHAACKAPKDAVVLKAGAKPTETAVETPVGALGLTGETPVATYYLDLAGKPADSKGKATFTLSWDNPAADYDLVVNGVNEYAVSNPEVVSIKAAHCRPIQVGIDVFAGVPVDTISLSAKGA